MKPVRLTLHAEVKCRERNIRFGWIEETVRHPEWIEPEPRDTSLERRFRSVAAFGDGMLRVVCGETETEIRIVTATFDRDARRP